MEWLRGDRQHYALRGSTSGARLVTPASVITLPDRLLPHLHSGIFMPLNLSPPREPAPREPALPVTSEPMTTRTTLRAPTYKGELWLFDHHCRTHNGRLWNAGGNEMPNPSFNDAAYDPATVVPVLTGQDAFSNPTSSAPTGPPFKVFGGNHNPICFVSIRQRSNPAAVIPL